MAIVPSDSRRPSPKDNRVRLQKFLADCGAGSRRACEALIDQGLVAVDGEIVRRQGVTLDPDQQSVTLRGKRVSPPAKVYLALNKPRDVVCTSHDPQGRRTVQTFVPRGLPRVYTVGRLDRDSEGLLLLTNDGAFAHALAHPRHHITKTYLVWADGILDRVQQERMLRGMVIDGESMQALSISQVDRTGGGARYRVILGQGRKRQIRRMFEASGVRVRRLLRTGIGSLELGTLKSSEVRTLRVEEVRALLDEAASFGR